MFQCEVRNRPVVPPASVSGPCMSIIRVAPHYEHSRRRGTNCRFIGDIVHSVIAVDQVFRLEHLIRVRPFELNRVVCQGGGRHRSGGRIGVHRHDLAGDDELRRDRADAADDLGRDRARC